MTASSGANYGVGGRQRIRPSSPYGRVSARADAEIENGRAPRIACSGGAQWLEYGRRFDPNTKGASSSKSSANITANPERIAELDPLGDKMTELSDHLDPANARLLVLSSAVPRRDRWNAGFRSCRRLAHLADRAGRCAGREHVRVARALGALPPPGPGARPRELLILKGPGADPQRHAGDRGAAAGVGPRRTTEHSHGSSRAGAGGPAGQGWGGSPAARRPDAARVSDETVPSLSAAADTGSRRALVQALAACRRRLSQRAREKDPKGDPPTMVQQQADALALLAETASTMAWIQRRASATRGWTASMPRSWAEPEQPGKSSRPRRWRV